MNPTARPYLNDPVEECIQSIKEAETRQSTDRLWELRADEIRKRELFTNLEVVRSATKERFDRLSTELPDRHLEFHDNPARYFVVRNSSISGATVNVGMSLDGAVLTIKTTHHNSSVTFPETTESIRIEVEGNATYFFT